jgi:uncharacterized protein YecE (DUF72 family)
VRMAPTKVNYCYNKEDFKDWVKTIAANKKDKKCTVTDQKQSGNKVTWEVTCSGQNASVLSGETVYTRDAYDSAMKIQTKGRTINMKVKAKRLGDCP